MNLAKNFEHHFRFLGLTCKDRITGFVGVGASVCFDAYGCIQTCLTPPVVKGKSIDDAKSAWFDNNRLEIVSKKQVQPLPDFLMAPKDVVATDARGGFDKPAR